jgi:hypothetical protein
MRRQLRMPDRVHAPINPMQPPRANRPFDGLRELELLFQLSNRHDSVLSPRKERQTTIARRHVRSRAWLPGARRLVALWPQHRA